VFVSMALECKGTLRFSVTLPSGHTLTHSHSYLPEDTNDIYISMF